MRLTTKGRYAVKAMLDIAIRAYESGRWNADDTGNSSLISAIALADIAERQDISTTYLEQLFRKLRKSGLVNSVRGPGGGYVLARDVEQISIADIMTAVGEGIDVAKNNSSNPNKLAENLWADLTNQIHGFLANISLADLIARHENKQLSQQMTEQQRQLFDFDVSLGDMPVNGDKSNESAPKRKNLILVSNNS